MVRRGPSQTPERKLVTGVGEVSIEQPRVHDRRLLRGQSVTLATLGRKEDAQRAVAGAKEWV